MGLTLSRLIGAAATLLALARLDRLLEPSIAGPPWQAVLVAAVVLGAGVSLLTRTSRVSRGAAIATHLVALAILAARVMAPDELIGGLIPGPAAIEEGRLQLGIAAELIRFGAAPVLPVPGLTAVLAAGFWAIGILLAGSRPALHTLPPLIAYLQFATLDRRPPGTGWILTFVVVGTLALTALTVTSKESIGRVYTRNGEILARRSPAVLGTALILAAMLGVTSANALARFIPESGVLEWRTQSGIGSGLYGSGSFNLFVGLQQSLVRLSDEPMFFARLSSSAPPTNDLYWRLITLDVFDGEHWRPSEQTFARGGDARWERTDWAFQGATTRVAANIRIAGLSGQYLPTLYSPVDLSSDQELIAESFRVREDGAIAIDLQAIDGWTYQVDADVPIPDLATLATRNGELSPIFQEAVDAGALDLAPARQGASEERPESIDGHTALPDNVSDDVRSLARDLTQGGSTPFERALLLESFFRNPEQFTYSTDVDTGHASLDLADWLLEPDSINYRTGYCEQFATAMAVMARSLRIPSRVVLGFTPGTVETQADGSEIVVVRERNAHAWVELWMDGQGWVKFDPTPRSDGANPSVSGEDVGFDVTAFVPAPGESSPLAAGPQVPVVPDRLDEGEVPLPGDGSGALGRSGAGLLTWLAWIAGMGALAGMVPVYKLWRRRRRMSRITDGEVAAAWEEIVDRLSDLGTTIDPAHTPIEIARRESPDLIPLARLYSAAAYGAQTDTPCLDEFTRAEQALRRRYDNRRWRTSYVRVTSLRR